MSTGHIPASPEYHRLAERIQNATVISWEGDVFRFCDMTFANLTDLITGEGSSRAGGRWNGKNQPTLYFSLDPETALAELFANSRHQNVPDSAMTPVALTACHVHVARVLNLADPAVRRLLGVSARQLREVPWRAMQHAGQEPVTQAIGRLARAAGMQGLLVMSARQRRGLNLVLFRESVSDREVQILHPERLPKRRRRSLH
jgi:RES domain-containing protein